MNARDEILRRVRSAVGAPSTIEVPRHYRTIGDHAPGSAQVLDLLVDRLVDYAAHVHRVPDLVAVPETITDLLTAARAVVVPHGLDSAWLTRLGADVVVRDSADSPHSAEELDRMDAVVTAARVAVADTGTIVLDGEPDQGRRIISLVPDTHVCVVVAEQVVHTLPEAVRLLARHPERPQTWISGPSATSDIELSRVEGVHGPRTLHVVLVEHPNM